MSASAERKRGRPRLTPRRRTAPLDRRLQQSAPAHRALAASLLRLDRAHFRVPSFLIDLTDPRFFTPENADVLAFIRRVNPFAHSDLGTIVFECARRIDDAQAYCPSPSSCAYVVLHTPSHRIVAIAYDQRGLAIRLGAPARAEAIAAGHKLLPAIGADWVAIDPWPAGRARGEPSACDWMARAYAAAIVP